MDSRSPHRGLHLSRSRSPHQERQAPGDAEGGNQEVTPQHTLQPTPQPTPGNEDATPQPALQTTTQPAPGATHAASRNQPLQPSTDANDEDTEDEIQLECDLEDWQLARLRELTDRGRL